ncbi:MAG: TetR/AcrR family transcriptional regulator [bacterium]|nr:TetR/AcrR family transcriptional regulator [bacterium]
MTTDKQAHIIEIAMKLFIAKGFHGVPTSLIAKEAGVATGTLFHHFKTKEELINKIYTTVKVKLMAAIYSNLEGIESIRGRIRRIWLNSMRWYMAHPEHLAFMNQFYTSPFITAITREETMHHLKPFYSIIEEGKRLEIVKDIPDDFMVDIEHALTSAMAKHFIKNPETFTDEKYRETVFDVFWDCFRR